MSGAPDLEELRALVLERTAARGYRKVAAQIGCSPSGLHDFVQARTTPSSLQRRRLECWYAEQRGERPPAAATPSEVLLELVRQGRRLNPVGIIKSCEVPMELDETPEAAREREAALVRRFVSGTDAERAESFMTIYGRFRGAVREELERAGLAAQEAEQRVGAVFGRTLAAMRREEPTGDGTTLRERLMEVAHNMAEDPEWRPSR